MHDGVEGKVADDAVVPGWVIALLVAVAIVETLGALSSVPDLFGDGAESRGLGGWTIIATIVAHPVFAIAALVFAVRGQVDRAVVALSAVVLIGWLRMLPAVVIHGVEMRGAGFVVLHEVVQVFLFPALALSAIMLTLRGERLRLAAVLVCLPTLVGALGVVAFAISVSIYGF